MNNNFSLFPILSIEGCSLIDVGNKLKSLPLHKLPYCCDMPFKILVCDHQLYILVKQGTEKMNLIEVSIKKCMKLDLVNFSWYFPHTI
jgi:hypothetical protein